MADDFVGRFIKEHKEYFSRNEKIIESNTWNEVENYNNTLSSFTEQVLQISNSNKKDKEKQIKELQKEIKQYTDSAKKTKEALFKQENDLTNSILGRLSAFIKETEDSGDRKNDRVQPFIDLTVNIISLHINKCNKYLAYNLDAINQTVENEQEAEYRSSEIVFQDEVFTSKIKIQSDLHKLNISGDIDNVKITFFKDQKATIPMIDVLKNYSTEIRELTKKLKLPKKVEDIEFYIHKEKREEDTGIQEIPQWEEKKHYWEQKEETLIFWYNEWLKITVGFTVDGYYFHPWLYYHLNFYKTPIPQKDGTEPIINPTFRDTEQYFSELLKKCEEVKNRGILLYGSRRIGKSVMMSSICEWKALIKDNASTAITSGSAGDLAELTHKMKTSMKFKVPAFQLPIQKQEWDGGTVELGLKWDASTLIEHSRHTIKNLSGGATTSTQKTAGGAPSVFLIEEIGKTAWEKAYLAAIPSFETPDGFKTTIIAVGCVCAGTKVWTNSGELVNIEDLKQEQGILGYNGEGVSKEPITWMKPPAKKECVRITTVGGYEIECSVDHPFLTSTSKKINQNIPKSYFKRADQLEVGDSLFKPEAIDVFGETRIEDARMIGLLIGDGYYGRNTPSLSIGDEEIYDYISKNYKISIKKEFETKKGGTFREVIISGQVPLMNKLGMSGQTKENKQIPKAIFEADEWTVREFLAGYFDADGHVNYCKEKGVVRVVLTSVNKHVLEDVSFLLTKIGIYSTINKEYNGYGTDLAYSGKKEYCYNLYINRVKDVVQFHSKINLLCKHKTDTLEKVFNRDYKHHSGFKKELTFKYDENFKKGIHFKDKKTKNLNTVRIKSIEYIGEKDVYNLTAGTTNTYLANGFITHNTSGEASLSKDAMKAVSNPSSFKFLEMDWDLLEKHIPPEAITWKRRTFANFVPAQMAYKTGFKRIERRFGDFLGIESEYLNKIIIHQTDWINNTKVLKEAREEVKKDALKLQQETIQYPIDPEECFLSAEKNPFPYMEAVRRKQYLLESGEWDRRRILYKGEDGRLQAEISTIPLIEYPHKGGTADAPLLIFEDIPITPQPDNLYVASFDDVKQDDSDTDSLISFQIWKMETFNDEWAGRMVLSWTLRPENRRPMYEKWLLLQQAYNARAFPENEDMGYKSFLETKHLDERWLISAVDFTSAMNINSNQKRKYGWTPRQSKRVLLGILKDKLEDPTKSSAFNQDNGDIMGIQTMNDIGFLEEIINYKEDNNVDRISAALGAVGWMHYLTINWMLPKQVREQTQEEKEYKFTRTAIRLSTRRALR